MSDGTAGGTTIRIATFNIRHGRPTGSTSTDNDQMARSIAALGADVVGLQEVDSGLERSGRVDQAALAADRSGLSPHFAPVVGAPTTGEYGNALLYGGDLIDVEDVLLPSEGAEQRGAILARLRVGGIELTVAVTHLAHERAGRPHNAAMQLDHLIDLLVDSLDRSGGPGILMGDLNLGAAAVVPRMEAAGFTVADTGATFPASEPTRRIDWIGLRGLDVAVVVVPAMTASDHRPIVAEVERRPGG